MVFFLVWQVNVSIHVMLLLEYLKNLAFFEFLKKQIYRILQKVECTADYCSLTKIETGLKRLGTESLFENATVFVIAAGALWIVYVLFAVLYFVAKYCLKVRKLFQVLKEKLVWNALI